MGLVIDLHKNKVIVYDSINRIYFSPLNSKKDCNFAMFKYAIQRASKEPMSYNDIMTLANKYKVGCSSYKC